MISSEKSLFCQLDRIRTYFGLIIFVIAPFIMSAQVGIGTDTPDPSAQLDVTASDKGFLVPRVTRRTDVLNPADGLIVYQTSMDRGLWLYDGMQWVKLAKTSDIPTEVGTNTGGTIIPFSSGSTPVTLSTDILGNPANSQMISFGSFAEGPAFFLGSTNLLLDGTKTFAFSSPRNGILTDMSASVTLTNGINLTIGTAVTLRAQLYVSEYEDSNNFIPVAGAVCQEVI